MGKKRRRGDEGMRSRVAIDRHALYLYLFFFLVSFVCFVGKSSAQDLGTIQTNIASGNVELIRNALFQIKNLHTEAASRLALPALSNANPIVRATAANAVIFLPKAEAIQYLIPLLTDKTEFVRGEAAFALGEVRDPSGAVPLIRALEKDRSRVVKAAAAAALGKTGNRSAVEPLGKILIARPNEDSEFLRRCSAHAIGMIAESELKQKTTTTTPENFLPDEYKNGYVPTIVPGGPVLSQSPEFRKATAILSKVLENKNEADDTRREAAFALGAIRDPASAPLLRSHLRSPDTYLAEICKEALIKIEMNK